MPSSIIFDLTFIPTVRDTAIQLMALAWGKNETPAISFSELAKLTGKSIPTLYAHMGLLRNRGALRWRTSGMSTIIVELLDGMNLPENSSQLEMPDHLNPLSIKSTRTKIKNSDSSTLEISSPSESAPRPRDPMFDAIVSVTQIDPTIKSAAASVGKARRELLQAKPPYTADEVLAFGVWWNGDDWRRKNGPPACHAITQKIGVIRNGNGGNGNGTGKRNRVYTDEERATAAAINEARRNGTGA